MWVEQFGDFQLPNIKNDGKTILHTGALKYRDVLGYSVASEMKREQADIQRLQDMNQAMSGILGRLYRIQELQALNTIANVEHFERKIKQLYQQIEELLTRYEQDPDFQQQVQASGPQLEKHPDLPDSSGMPLKPDQMDREFLEALGIENLNDKAEVENQSKKKVQERLKTVITANNKLVNKLKSKPAFKPGGAAHPMINNYEHKVTLVKKLIAMPMPPAPAPTPTPRYISTPKPSIR